MKCPRHKEGVLEATEKEAEHTVIDLVFAQNGCRKRVIRYVGVIGHCPRCQRGVLPPRITELKNRLFGHAFQAWAVYQRITLRLPYRAISEAVENLFCEHVSKSCIVKFMTNLAEYYASTEKILL